MKDTPKGGWKPGRDSRHKMVVYFKDGNRITRYSYDWKGKYAPKKDEEFGLKRLFGLLTSYGNNPKTVLLYDNTNEQLLRKFVHGVEVEI
ncbi:MAG: hypothetical protein JXQ90_18205 [Cyclobacteriaceae bacterium]